ncbi:MAG: ABC transporter ATP-binding protein/permease [Oscillospiraceae bacterium]|jgi:ATP-binding cassette subfamily B protein|nr:ABC transporter ATP-binding protein/permease [Oscillospiraceae bacterium]
MKKKERIMIRLFFEARPIWKGMALACLLCCGVILCAVTGPKLLGNLIDRLYIYWDGTFTGDLLGELLPGLGALLAVYVLHSVFNWAKMYLLNNTVSRFFTCALRIRISDKIQRLPVSYVDQTSVGDVLSRMTDDVSSMGNYIHRMIDILMSGFLTIIAIAVMMVAENWRLAIIVLVLTPISIFLSSLLAARSEKYFHDSFEKQGQLNAIIEESYTNHATTKAYNLETYTQEKLRTVNLQQRDSHAKAVFTSSIVRPLITFTDALAYITICLIGGWLILNDGSASVGAIITILLYAKQFATPLEEIAEGLGTMQHAKAAARRVFSLLDMPDEPAPDGKFPSAVEGTVRFSHVDFSYNKKEPLIQDLNVEIKQGQSIAIVGPTGAGKTTIVNLLMRFYDIDSGKICIDGVDCSTLSRDEVRAQFGMVLQDAWLFSGTIAENVAYGKPDATREEIIAACDRAYCDHFIRTLPGGYDTVIGDDTTTLSGGQKQLLTIARAMLCDRRLLILDEATSNVDTRTEILLQKAMDRLMKNRTCFVIAHRLSTIIDSDLILVLDQGRIVEQGTHQELLNRKGFYHKIYTSQYAI